MVKLMCTIALFFTLSGISSPILIFTEIGLKSAKQMEKSLPTMYIASICGIICASIHVFKKRKE